MKDLTVLIKKLGHNLEEIRLRSLQSILSKLELGLLNEHELLHQDSIFNKLVEWFSFDSVPEQHKVLQLILRLIKAEGGAGAQLLIHADPGLCHLREVKGHDAILQDIINGTSHLSSHDNSVSPDEQDDGKKLNSFDIKYSEPADNKLQISTKTGSNDLLSCFHIWSLPEVPLVSGDLNVLDAIEESLHDVTIAEKTCHFFSTVILQDFPPETFLHHPGIIKGLLDLISEAPQISTAAVKCLSDFTFALHTQLNYHCDPATASLKHTVYQVSERSEDNAPDCEDMRNATFSTYNQRDKDHNQRGRPSQLKLSQISIPQFCVITLHYVASLCGSSQNIGSPLMPRLLRLFRACLADAKLVWTSQHFVIRDLIQYIYETMVKLGFAIKHSIVQVPVMRVHVITATTQLLKAIVPLNIATSVVPNILKEAITSCILDPAVIILYPHIHKLLLKYNAACKLDAESMYNDVKRVTDSMQSSIQFIRKAGIITATEALAFFEASMLSLPFHKHLHMISLFIQLCIEKWKLNNKETEVASRIVCMLLAHTETDITLETYKVVHKNIICFFGPEQAAKILDPTLQLSFILTPKVFTEIVCHGTTHVDTQIQQYACDILTYILKCRMLIPETSWLKILSAMAPVLPLLQCHAGKSMPLQRTVINILDPDISKTIGLSELQVISGNIRLMFSKDRISREEGVARLVWLLSLGESVHSNLADICMIEKCLTSKQLVNVYDIGSIVRVLEVLTGTCADDRVCQSALTQISVMTEDPQLHSIFLEYHGLPVLLKIFTSSMENVEAAGGCAIPIVATMKNLSRHSAKVREELSQNVTFYCNIVRALFRLSEWRLQRDGTQLLALLVYADYIISTSDYISFPQIVTEKMHLPFDTKSHWSVSINVQPTLRGVLLGNKEVQNVLSLQWAIAREDIHSVLNWLQPPADLPKDLVLPKYVLCSLQQSSVKLNCNGLLHAIQNATTHGAVIDAICDLYRFIELSWMCKAGELSQLPWQETFSRFILSSPSCLQDYQLLLIVLRFLTFLAAVQKDQVTWMRHSLCAVPNALIKLLIDANIDTTSQEDGLHDLWKEVCLEVLSLSEKCMKNGEMKGWEVLTNSIVHCLDSSRQKNFYCLALLDRRLRCLQIQLSLHPVDSSILWQLITAFHCDNELSCMGLSITRQTLFCLNCLLINNHSTQNWEDLWIKPENMRWLPSLWKSRDFLVRASTLQLIAGLCISSRGTMVVSKYLDSIWEISLGFAVDQTEASLVREQAAVLLSNISRHIEQQGMRKIYVKMAEDAGLYQELAIAVTQLTLEPKIEFELTLHLPNCLLPVSPRQETTDSELTDAELLPTTPGFIKAGCFLLNNIIALSEDDCIKYINSQGLSKVLFTCLLEQRKLVNAESLEMMSAMMNLLCYCVETYDNLPVDLAYTLINFLDPSFISGLKQESKIQEESVKRFYQETLKLLAVITANSEISISPVSKGVVDTLCECLDQTDSVSLKRTAILVIPSVITIIPTDLSAYICKALLKQWDLHMQKKKLNLLKALSCLVEQSEEATAVALQEGLLQHLIKMLRHNIVAFTVDAGVILKSTKGNSSLNNMLLYFDTINNFMAGSAQVKLAAEQLELADIVHKLWVWCQTDTKIIVAALNMLITFTANCPQAARSLVMTSTLAGVGQRKSPSSLSLVHAVICLLTKEFHPLIVCKHALLLLSHLCQAPECRAVISKSMLLQRFVNVLQDKKQIGKEAEYMWLQFLKIFTYFPEGQHCVIETEELFELLLKQSVASSHSRNRVLATFVIHNVGFSLSNRTRLLTSKSFLKFICEKLLTGEHEEKEYVSIIIWALIANNQKAKVILRNLQILNHLQLASATHSCEVFGVVRSLLENDSTS